jgi:hypothetical protein
MKSEVRQTKEALVSENAVNLIIPVGNETHGGEQPAYFYQRFGPTGDQFAIW